MYLIIFTYSFKVFASLFLRRTDSGATCQQALRQTSAVRTASVVGARKTNDKRIADCKAAWGSLQSCSLSLSPSHTKKMPSESTRGDGGTCCVRNSVGGSIQIGEARVKEKMNAQGVAGGGEDAAWRVPQSGCGLHWAGVAWQEAHASETLNQKKT